MLGAAALCNGFPRQRARPQFRRVTGCLQGAMKRQTWSRSPLAILAESGSHYRDVEVSVRSAFGSAEVVKVQLPSLLKDPYASLRGRSCEQLCFFAVISSEFGDDADG